MIDFFFFLVALKFASCEFALFYLERKDDGKALKKRISA